MDHSSDEFVNSGDEGWPTEETYEQRELEHAIWYSEVEKVKALLDSGIEVKQYEARLACAREHAIMRLVLGKLKVIIGGTQLVSAAINAPGPHARANVRYLLDSGADVCLKEVKQACKTKTEVLELLVQHWEKTKGTTVFSSSLLCKAVSAGPQHVKKNMQLILSAGVPVDSRCEKGEYAIEKAVRKRKPESLKVLLDAGASVEVATRSGDDLIEVAIKARAVDCLKVLLEKRKMDLNKDYEGGRALELAVTCRKSELVKLLLEHGAELYPQSKCVRYIYPRINQRAVIACIVPALARETVEGRFINREDVDTLERYHRGLHLEYTEACQEWHRARETSIVRRVPYAHLVEKPDEALYWMYRTPGMYQHMGAYKIGNRFPRHKDILSRALMKLLKTRGKWIRYKRKISGATRSRVPCLVAEKIAYYAIQKL